MFLCLFSFRIAEESFICSLVFFLSFVISVVWIVSSHDHTVLLDLTFNLVTVQVILMLTKMVYDTWYYVV